MNKKSIKFFLLTTFALLSCKGHTAGSMLVWPILQVIEANEQGSALWLENRGSRPVRLQIRVLNWLQVAYRDRYSDQNNVIASPPFATVLPQQRQLIRLIRTGSPPGQGEQAYRIIIDEIPDISVAAEKNSAGLRLQMRYVLPLFLYAPGVWTESRNDQHRAAIPASQPQLRWQQVTLQGKSVLQIHNQGAVHARLTNVFWGMQPLASKASLMLAKGFLGYVLPGQTMQFPLPSGRAIPAGATLYAQLSDNSSPVALSQ